jgi:ribose 5-phosphate isomerase B
LHQNVSVDYPDYAHPVAEMVEKGEAAFGILLCGSANGVCMTANKHQGIRAGLSWQKEVAQLIRQHNDANIICIPARFVTLAEAKEMIQIFMDTPFEGGRHQNRVNKIRCS